MAKCMVSVVKRLCLLKCVSVYLTNLVFSVNHAIVIVFEKVCLPRPLYLFLGKMDKQLETDEVQNFDFALLGQYAK